MSGPRVRMCVVLGFALLALGALASACSIESESKSESQAAEAKAKFRSPADNSSAKNLVMVSLDTLRADHVGHYGYARATTPNLDRFAEAAVVFEHALAQASSTRPSHQSLFQSRPASAAAANRLALAEVLAEKGFRTAAFTGGGNISHRLGFARGFERYEERDSGLAGTLPTAASWVREHRNERFFLFLHTYDIHLPYDPPEPFASMFGDDYEGIVTGPGTRQLLRQARGLDGFESEALTLDANDRDRVIALYDGGIRYTDGQLVHLFNLADELDLYRDTLFVFFSDHGEEFWEHGSTIHSHSLYQELLHVPLLIRGPDLSPGRVGYRVPMMDLAPTVLELLGMPSPEEFEGKSLAALIAGQEAGDRVVVSEQRALKSWIDYPWKLVVGASEQAVELYDLSSDPEEQNNLAAVNHEIVARFSARLDARLAGHRSESVPELEPGLVDPEHLERLRVLGYIE